MSQSTIDFLLNNNIAIIQTIFAVIFFLVVFVILRSFKEEKSHKLPPPSTIKERRIEEAKYKKEEEKKAELAAEESPLDDLDNLDDLVGVDPGVAPALTNNGDIPPPADFVEAADTAQSSSKPSVPPDSELAAALSEKEKIITELKAEIQNLKNKGPEAGSEGLEDKVRELTEKLSEYEIIEDDIANLSFYKSENTKLKNELDKLKGEAGSTVLQEEEKNNASSSNEVLNEFEETVKQKEALEKNVIEPSFPAPSNDDANLLKEFENAVEKEFAPGEPAAVAAEKANPPEEIPKEISEKSTEKSPEENPKEEAPINPDKLVQEVETLASTEPPEVKDDGKDSSQKLIEEFENFVNKG